jgi:hypothetical protein
MTTRSLWTDLAAALTLGAALVHAAAAGTHTGDSTQVALFAGTALVQGAVGLVLLGTASRAVLLGSALINGVCVAAWAMSRTVGLPVIDARSGVEAVGTQDLVAATLAALSIAAAVAGLVRAAPTMASRLGWLPVLALVPAVVGVSAPHAHGDDRAHDRGTEAAAHDPAPGDGGGHAHEPSDAAAALAADPLLVGADTTHATEEELQAAVGLVEATRTAIDPNMDVEEAEAAGYVWIGDGRRPGGYQHYINHEYMSDGVDLDPARIESLVFENTAAGPELVSTMYLLAPGSTMDDVPEVAGELTVWHDHQNLCWDESGTRLAGVSTDGKTCRPGGELRATSPMLHVWLVDNECGPFAGIEGHGAEGCGTHEH